MVTEFRALKGGVPSTATIAVMTSGRVPQGGERKQKRIFLQISSKTPWSFESLGSVDTKKLNHTE